MPPLDVLPNAISIPSRDDVIAQYKRDYALRNQNVSSTDALVDADARTFADQAMQLHAHAVVIQNNVRRSRATGTALTQWSNDLGGGGRLPASGAVGFVTAGPGTAVAGATIFSGDEFKIAGLRYKCLLTQTYFAGDPIPGQGIDTGPQTDQPAGAKATWTSPRPGADPTSLVTAQSDGSGLSGGHNEESDDELQTRLDFLEANPAASGNESEYIQRVLSTPAVPVGAAFVYPDILGPGSVGVIFTLRASKLGGNRIPNAAQIALVLAWLTGRFPASDAIFVGTIVAQTVDTGLKVSWAASAPAWTDLTPWPPYQSPMTMASGAIGNTPTTFTLDNCIPAPPVGATIGFFNANTSTFSRKRILTATHTAGNSYAIVCDTTNGISDTVYTPNANQPCCPWSDSLDSISPAVLGYFDGLGPGEQVASFFDPGLRQRRSPASPQFSPSIINNRIIPPVEALGTVADATLVTPAIGSTPPTGTPGVNSAMWTMRSLTVFPE